MLITRSLYQAAAVSASLGVPVSLKPSFSNAFDLVVDHPDAEQVGERYSNGELMVNARIYADAINDIKNKIKDEQNRK